ncbi:unnamed protein product [Cuscuta campestris]|uniref:DUF4218 domain-containing protein n=1 Tax=Cuscuta campestris TaxID=132261 RepID=A0A484LEE6_9ASTE|nr:unnamed protein product [Cuscuta campestris]
MAKGGKKSRGRQNPPPAATAVAATTKKKVNSVLASSSSSTAVSEDGLSVDDLLGVAPKLLDEMAQPEKPRFAAPFRKNRVPSLGFKLYKVDGVSPGAAVWIPEECIRPIDAGFTQLLFFLNSIFNPCWNSIDMSLGTLFFLEEFPRLYHWDDLSESTFEEFSRLNQIRSLEDNGERTEELKACKRLKNPLLPGNHTLYNFIGLKPHIKAIVMTSKPKFLSETTKCEGILWNQEETEQFNKGKRRIPKLVFNTNQALPPTLTVDAIKTILAVSQPKCMPNTKGLNYYFEKPFEREHMSVEKANQLFVVEEARDTDLEEKLIHSDLGYQLERDNPSILVNASTESKEELLHISSDCQLEVTSSWRVNEGSPQMDASPYKYRIKKREKIEQSTMMLYGGVVQISYSLDDSLVVLVGKLPKAKGEDTIVEIADRMNGYTHYMALTHPYTAVEAAQYYLTIHGVDLQRTLSYHSQLNGLSGMLSEVETVREWPVPTKEKELVAVVHDDMLQTTKVAGCYGQLPVHILNAGPVKWECTVLRTPLLRQPSTPFLAADERSCQPRQPSCHAVPPSPASHAVFPSRAVISSRSTSRRPPPTSRRHPSFTPLHASRFSSPSDILCIFAVGVSRMSPFKNRELMYKKYEREGVVSQEWVDSVVEFVEYFGPTRINSVLEEEPNSTDKHFFEMLKAADTDLWPGSSKMSQLSAVARLLNIKYLNRLKRMVKNKARVEGSIANAYLVREASYFCSHYFEEHVYTRARNVPRNDPESREGVDVTNQEIFDIFQSPGRLQGKMRKRQLTPEELKAAHHYVLFNCLEIDPYITLCANEIKESTSQISEESLLKRVEETFAN